VDARVLGFTLAITLLTALLFSLFPAVRAGVDAFPQPFAARRRSLLRRRPRKSATFTLLREAGAAGGLTRSRLRHGLVVAQVALSALLLFGGGLLLRSLRHARGADPGFDARGVMLLTSSPDLLGYDEARGRLFWRNLQARVQLLPGVQAAALALFVPMGDRGDAMSAGPAGASSGDEHRDVPYNMIGPGYFDVMRVPLLRGRDFSNDDVAGGPGVAILSDAAAHRWFPGEDAVGKTVRIVDRGDSAHVVTVVGVARDIVLRSLGEAPQPLLYVPFGQWYRGDMILHIRSDDRPGLPAALSAELHTLDSALPVRLRTLAEASSFTLIPLRVASIVLGGAGAIGLFLAATGVFGVVAYTVSRQMRELAIRMALGAERGEVRRMVVLRALRLTALGLAIGLGAAIFAAQLVRSFLYGVGTADPLALLAVTLSFTGVSILAAWAPARRASRLDPAIVLRAE
jgi:predicted permease